jgi:iron complex transport system substrate-binding protein
MTLKKPWTLLIIAVAFLFCVFGLYLRAVSQRTLRAARTLRTKNSPERIVSLAPNLTEILFALDLGDKVVAVSNDSDYPPQVEQLKKIGAFFKPNTEAVISCEPDLVITLWFPEQKAVGESLRRLGYNVITVELQKLGQLIPAIEEISRTTGTEAAGEKLNKKINSTLEQISRKYRTTQKPKVLWVLQSEPLRVAGVRTFISELIELAGGQNAVGPTPQQYPQLGTEALLTCNAEVIIHSAMSKSHLAKEQKAAERFWDKFPDLPAVKNNRIYVIDADTILRLGPRLPQGIKKIAELLHPQQ